MKKVLTYCIGTMIFCAFNQAQSSHLFKSFDPDAEMDLLKSPSTSEEDLEIIGKRTPKKIPLSEEKTSDDQEQKKPQKPEFSQDFIKTYEKLSQAIEQALPKKTTIDEEQDEQVLVENESTTQQTSQFQRQYSELNRALRGLEEIEASQ